MITVSQAYSIASQWGSYNNSYDPGRCFYCFEIGDGRPVDETHRRDCLQHIAFCMSRLEVAIAMGTVHDEEGAYNDLEDLKELRAFMEVAQCSGAEVLS